MRPFFSLVAPLVSVLFLTRSSVAAVVPLQPRSNWSVPSKGGCWTDIPADRALQYFAGSFNDLTPDKCQSVCEQAGFNLAGTEYGYDCYCGNAILGNNRPLTAELCFSQCSGSADFTVHCGGPKSINIYVKDNYNYTVAPGSYLPSYNGYDLTQCWQDSASNRILKHSLASQISYNEMTVQKCITGCADAGYDTAGLENGGECYCDNVTSPFGQSAANEDCNIVCNGDDIENCGGPNRILIYQKPAIPTNRHSGIIKVVNANNVTHVFGYLSNNTDIGINTLALNAADAEVFAFIAPNGTTTQVKIMSTHGIGGYPFLGLVQGFLNKDNTLGRKNPQYTYIAGTSHAAPGATPQTGPNSYQSAPRDYETSVWTVNTATWEIIGVWVNPDNTLVPVTPIWWYLDDMFASGDAETTRVLIGNSNVFSPDVKFIFVPDP